LKSNGYVKVPRGLEVSDRGRLARECPVCGDLFYRDGQCVPPDHPADGYVRHWHSEHRDLRRAE
jgi:hypothetical protein